MAQAWVTLAGHRRELGYENPRPHLMLGSGKSRNGTLWAIIRGLEFSLVGRHKVAMYRVGHGSEAGGFGGMKVGSLDDHESLNLIAGCKTSEGS